MVAPASLYRERVVGELFKTAELPQWLNLVTMMISVGESGAPEK